METYSVLNLVAGLTLGMVVIRGIQAGTEHYFPNATAATVLRFIFGGP